MDTSIEKSKKGQTRFPAIATERSFMTEIVKVKDVGKGKEVSTSEERITEYQNLIKNQILNLNTDIDSVLQRHEQDFLNAFKCQMYNLYTQIKDLKKASNNTGVNLKHNEEIHKLQDSVVFYQKEAMRLEQAVEVLTKDREVWKEKAKELETDCKLYESRLKNAKRKLKLLKIGEDAKITTEPVLITTVETSAPPPTPKFVPSNRSGEVIAEILAKFKRWDVQIFKEIEIAMEKQSKHFAESTKHYKSIITNERRKMQNLSVMQSSVFMEKSDLENLFLDCVEEVTKEIGHRRAKSLMFQKFPLKTKETPKEKGEIFSPGDKRKIMELLISNEQVLIMLYEKLFPFRASHFGNPQKLDQMPALDQTTPDLDELLRSIPSSFPSNNPTIFSTLQS